MHVQFVPIFLGASGLLSAAREIIKSTAIGKEVGAA
jgi:hypothetical protein